LGINIPTKKTYGGIHEWTPTSAKLFGHVERKRKRMRDVQNMIYWLVVEPYPSEKYMCSSVGMMKFPILMKKTFMFQSTNQYG
jgi:hypothetical protein